MSWSYDETNLGTDTAAGRLNSVRLLVGDTDTTDQQVQDEEIAFALTQTGDNIYFAGSYVANLIASKYSRRVTTELDGALRAEYSDLAKQYRQTSTALRSDGLRFSGSTFSLYAGGVSVADIKANRYNSDRPKSSFYKDRFDNPNATTDSTDYNDV